MAPRSEDPKLIIRVINFELVQSICPRYVNVTDGRTEGRTDRQTDSRTDGRLTIAMPRFALRASRGNKNVKKLGNSLANAINHITYLHKNEINELLNSPSHCCIYHNRSTTAVFTLSCPGFTQPRQKFV